MAMARQPVKRTGSTGDQRIPKSVTNDELMAFATEMGASFPVLAYAIGNNEMPIVTYAKMLRLELDRMEEKEKKRIYDRVALECDAAVRFAADENPIAEDRAISGSDHLIHSSGIPTLYADNIMMKRYEERSRKLYNALKKSTIKTLAVILLAGTIITGMWQDIPSANRMSSIRFTGGSDGVTTERIGEYNAGGKLGFVRPAWGDEKVRLAEASSSKRGDIAREISKALKIEAPESMKKESGDAVSERLDLPLEYVSGVRSLAYLKFFNEDLLRFLLRESKIMGKYAFFEDKIVDTLLEDMCDELVSKSGGKTGYYTVKTTVALHAEKMLNAGEFPPEKDYMRILDILSSYCSTKMKTMKLPELLLNFSLLDSMMSGKRAKDIEKHGGIAPDIVSKSSDSLVQMASMIDREIEKLERNGVDISGKIASIRVLEEARKSIVVKGDAQTVSQSKPIEDEDVDVFAI